MRILPPTNRLFPPALPVLVLALVLALASAPRASADQLMPGNLSTGATLALSPEQDSGNASNLRISVVSEYVGSADFLKYRGGGVEIVPVNLMVEGETWSFEYGYSSFIWHGLGELPFGNGAVPWSGLHDLRVNYRFLAGSFLDDFHYRLGAQANMGFETAPPGCVGLGLAGELAYDVYEGWMLGVFLSGEALSPLNNDLMANFNVEMVLHVSRKHLDQALAYFGIDPNKPAGDVTFSLGYSSLKQVYRLDKNSPVVHNGYVGIERSTIGAVAEVSLGNGFSLSAGPEFHFFRKYSVYDSGGSRKSSYKLNESPGARLQVSWAF